MPPIRIFVSFSSDNAEFVRQLISRLEEQGSAELPVTVWKYQDPAGEIGGGERIPEFLQQQIDHSDIFIPVVTTAAFQSRHTQFEVAHALQCSARGLLQIVPVVSKQVEDEWTDEWPSAYGSLSNIRYRAADFADAESVEPLVIDLCHDTKIDYRPVIPEDSRLPTMSRFVDEVKQKCPRNKEHEIGIYRRLMVILSQFSAAFAKDDMATAERMITYFCITCDYEFPDEQFYYANIVRAVCQLLLNKIDAAERTLEPLAAVPLVDESYWGAIGYIDQQRQDYTSALAHYQQAHELCPQDSAALTGVVLNSIMCGIAVDVDDVFRQIEEGQLDIRSDTVKLKQLKAFAYANAGRVSEARRLFQELVDEGQAEMSTVIHFARLLESQGALKDAIQLLQAHRQEFDEPQLLHYLASYTAFSGDFSAAAGVFLELVQRSPESRKYRIEAAQILCKLRADAQARDVVAPLLDPREFPLPQTTADYYFDGFANWIGGNQERANYDFARSGFPPEKHYDSQF